MTAPHNTGVMWNLDVFVGYIASQMQHRGNAMNRLRQGNWVQELTLAALLTLGCGMPALVVAAANDCDRACMRGVLDQYLDAVFRHDATRAPLAANARATENAAPLANGAGVWRSVTGYGPVQRRYFDVPEGQAAYFGILNEGASPTVVSLRLKISSRRVTEAEWTIARKDAGGLFSIEGLIAVPPRPDDVLPAGQRTSRAQLISLANAYFDGVEQHDGSRVPKIDGCERVENGVKVTHRPRSTPLGAIPGTAPAPAPAAVPAANTPGAAQEEISGDCTAGLEIFKTSIAKAAHRRFPVVDEEAGVVMGTTIFHRPPGHTMKRNLLTEYFYGQEGKIAAIYAAMYYLDPAAPDNPGWPTDSVATTSR